MLQIDAGVYVWFAALLLLLPFDWVLSAFTAAIVHEFCHAAVLVILGGRIRNMRISVSGCVMDAESPSLFASLCSILAGPTGSIALLLFCRKIPKIAVCGLFHGVYNLLPLRPLDGGRFLELILKQLCPGYADTTLLWAGRLICVAVSAVTVWYFQNTEYGVIPTVLMAILIIKLLPRKRPCKPSKIGVQ